MAKKTTQIKSKEEKTEKKVSSSQSKILKNLARRLSDDYHPSENYSSQKDGENKDPQIRKINRIIHESAKEISGNTDDKSEKRKDQKYKPSFSPSSFDGISDPKEERTLFIEQIKHLERDNSKLKHELELLHEDFQKETANLKKNVRDLRGEIHRTAPLTDNKLFHFSRELRHIAGTVEALSDDGKSMLTTDSLEESQSEINFPIQKPISDSKDDVNKTIKEAIISTPKEVSKPLESQADESKGKTKKDNKNKTKKKIELSAKQKTVGGVTAGALLAFITLGAIITNSSRVDNEVVETFLEEQNAGQIQGVTTTSKIQGRPDQRNNQVTSGEIEWEIFRDDFLGLQLEYPANAVDLLHTGNTITFLRYDGYLYKAQRIASEETTQEYFERTQVGGLEYSQEETSLNGKEALHLILKEETEYPGNRYIAQKKGYIYDIWYATESAKFNSEDLKIVDKMLTTTRFP